MIRPPLPAPAPAARRIELVSVGVADGTRWHYFGLLVGQVRAILHGPALALRPPDTAGGPPNQVLWYEGAWLPVVELAGALGLLPVRATGRGLERGYVLIIQARPDRRFALRVDSVADLRGCHIDQVLPVPSWLRRQLRPSLVWAAVDRRDLAAAPAQAAAPLILLLDGAALLPPPDDGR